MTLRPLRGYVLIEPIKEDEKTSVGVYLPETAKDKPMKGKVVAVGENETIVEWHDGTLVQGVKRSPVSEGDTVYYKKWGGEDIKEDGKEYVFVKFEDLLGVWEAK